jgi:hypothetical protein
MKRIVSLIVLVVLAISLSACWPGEIGVTTTFNADGSGTRVIVIDVMDDSLSSTPIINPDDPAQTEGKGAVQNDKYLTGGVEAIQTWLQENAPDFITVEAVITEGYHRYFTMTYDFDSFDDFLDKYEQLVNLSPTLSWDDFSEAERPTLDITGGFKKTVTFKETKEMLEASYDWAVDGIWTDIYDEADLAGWVTKADISVLANYTVNIGTETLEELRYYDAAAADGDANTGKVIFVVSDDFELSGEFANVGLIAVVAVGAVAVIGGAVFFVLKIKK